MAWQIELSDQVVEFLDRLSDEERIRVVAVIGLLEQAGPSLPTPYSKLIVQSKHKNMKELRIDYGTSCFRILYAFDTTRKAVLLAAADKDAYGYERFYDDFIPLADELFDARLTEISRAKAAVEAAKKSSKQGKKADRRRTR